MITTVTLNASIDKAYRIACELAPGTVMRVAEAANSAGGKGLNCARAVATCGDEVCATGFAGGHNGRLLLDLAAADSIPCDFVQVEAETRCCINVLEKGGRSTELLEPGRSVTSADVNAVVDKVAALAARSDAVTLNGSAPIGAGTDVYQRLIGAVRAAGKPALLDTSGELLAESLAVRPYLVKPNADEVAALLGRRPQGPDEAAAAARALREQHGIEVVVVSLGGAGAVMSCATGEYRGQSPRIVPVNTVGCGDTLVGAFAVGLARGMDAPACLRFAMACASANCLTPGTGRFSCDDARELAERTVVSRL